MFRWLQAKRKEDHDVITEAPYDAVVKAAYESKTCPVCGTTSSLCAGPEGPGFQNHVCDTCGSRFNMGTMFRTLHWTHGPQSPTVMGNAAKEFPPERRVANVKALIERHTSLHHS